jgi:hypothetical protein
MVETELGPDEDWIVKKLTSVFKIRNVQEAFRYAINNLRQNNYKKGFAENSI